MKTGIIFDIKEFSIFDGPGIRQTVFLKGCPLRCNWCHNPEGLSPLPQIMVSSNACLHCGKCKAVCEHPDKCVVCGKCVEICPANARRIAGTRMTSDELAARILKDDTYYRKYNGGVTFSGGEPLLQDAKELDPLVDALISRGIEVNFETNGSQDFTRFLRDGIIITADYKLPSSGMTDKMDTSLIKRLRSNDVLKFVVGSEDDIREMESIIDSYSPACHIFVSPVFGSMEPSRLAEWMKAYDFKEGTDIRLQVQLHKVIWSPEKRGV